MSDSLVVVSKVKKHVKDKAGMNTAADVSQILTEKVDQEIERAVQRARSAGRKTVMARDFE